MELILFLAGVFLLTFILGRLVEKIRIPWIFSALLIGLGLAAYNPFPEITTSASFHFLAQLGMFFLLFIIGFELDIKKILESSKFIISTTTVVILTETFFGTLLVHYVFNVPWLISILVASSFATVGEAVLLPILDEFNLVKTKLGQTILGIGALDDVFEVVTVIIASVLIGRSVGYTHLNIWTNLLILLLLFGLAFILVKLRKYLTKFKYKDIPSLFLFVLFFIFLFIGIGRFVESAALGALLAGIALRNIIPDRILNFIDSEIRTMAYGFFAPVFFLWVGVDTDIGYLVKFPLLILLILLMTNITKIISSYLMGRKVLGGKKSIILGISLCVKFSTSIVIIKLLFERGLIHSDLYSVLIGTTIAFKFVIPVLLAYLIPKWKLGFSSIKQVRS
ncbi:MAG TPA: cation:proton antiporter [Candidatus Woesearchaeota archaeon]|nr:cation:proton antiporter [Candidatus Woesearchaeota archaeon]